MTVVISPNLSLLNLGGELPNADNPLIGWRNVVTVGNINADSASVEFPVLNLANPFTHQLWRSLSLLPQYVSVIHNLPDDIDYVAIAGHNFGSENIAVSLERNVIDPSTKVLLNFNGTPGSQVVIDSSLNPKPFFTEGGLFIVDLGQGFRQLGQFNGTNASTHTPAHPDLNLVDNDFTLQLWFSTDSTSPGDIRGLAGQLDSSADAALSSWALVWGSLGNIVFQWSDGVGFNFLVSDTTFGTFSGLHHVVVQRTGGTLDMYIDGVLDASVSISDPINTSDEDLYVGIHGDFSLVTAFWHGYFDDFELINGVALYSGDFPLPTQERPWEVLMNPVIPATDDPLLFRFSPQSMAGIRVKLEPAEVPPLAAVMYVGKLLVLQRRLYVGHKPTLFNERVDHSIGLSDRGQYLGSIILSAWNESSIQQSNVTAAFYRSDVEPWRKQSIAQRQPFFFAWRPSKYPFEVAYCWPTGDMEVSNQLSNGMMQFSLSVRGIIT